MVQIPYACTTRKVQWCKTLPSILYFDRLVLVICQAGTAATAREDIAAQVRLWESAGFTGNIDAELLDIYRLLAGSAAPVTTLLGLDWRRAFAMHLW